jgi:hypothetical protein
MARFDVISEASTGRTTAEFCFAALDSPLSQSTKETQMHPEDFQKSTE